MNRRLQLLHDKLGKFFIPLLASLLTCFLFYMGYPHIKPQTYHFQLNQVAEETILAPVTIEDTEQTAFNQQRARDAINDIYLYQEDVRTQELTRIEQFFGFVRQVRNQSYSKQTLEDLLAKEHEVTEKEDDYKSFVDQFPSKKISFNELSSEQAKMILQISLLGEDPSIEELFYQLSASSIEQVIKISPEELSELQGNLTDFVSASLATELSVDDIEEELTYYRTQLAASAMSPIARQTTSNFLQALIKPTLVYSEKETNRLREEAASEVPLSYILQGQVIVQKGHIINKNNMRQLKLFGYLDESTKQFRMPVYIALTIIHAVLLVYLLSDKFKWTNLSQANLEMTAYTILMVGAISMVKLSFMLQRAGLEFAPLLVPMIILPIYLKAKSSHSLSLFLSLMMNLFAIFILFDIDNQTAGTLISLFYVLTSILSTLFISMPAYISLKTVRKTLVNSFWQVLVVLPLMVVLNIPLLSRQGILILLMVVAGNLLGLVLSAIFEPYWEQLLSSRAVMTMNQLANLNHPLLKRLIEQAPGTYHHSIMVANLAANAVEAIGGDSLTTRVATYYHDVGKTVHPLFFVENLSGGIESPHRMVNPDESAKIIIDHVQQGVQLLEEYYMPQSVIDICKQHHGTTLTQYFYYQAKEQKLPVNEEDFRYPGPVPQSKESAIVMLADSLEAASRTLKEYSQKSIEELVDSIIKSKVDDGQFVDCGLTVSELQIVRKSLILGIASMYHTRVEYPK